MVTESFLPTRNGVTTSVCRVLEHLRHRGHDAFVICPGPAPESFAGAPVVGVKSFRYQQFPVGIPGPSLSGALRSFAPDVVHLASPFVLGAGGASAARRLGVPSVAVFQTDVPGFAAQHGAGLLARPAWSWIRRLHEQCDLTLAPSTATIAALRANGVPRVTSWRRGVDSARFTPARRGTVAVRELRARILDGTDPSDPRVVVGYIGRLSAEKQVERLAELARVPGLADRIRLVIGGDGPARASVRRALQPFDPVMLGWLDGERLADAYAALDLFVHTGADETFGQTLQEAMASGVPVVAPRRGGPLDLVVPGTNGLLYRPESAEELAGCVQTLVADPALLRDMAATARLTVQGRTWEALGDELIGHYRTAIDTHPGLVTTGSRRRATLSARRAAVTGAQLPR